MGTLIDSPEIEFGDDCNVCVAHPYHLWPPGETPVKIYVVFSGLEPCSGLNEDLPNGRCFTLTQHETVKCRWVHTDSGWEVILHMWEMVLNSSILSLQQNDGKWAFYQTDMPCREEFHIYTNAYVVCAGPLCAINGAAIVSWHEIPRDIIEDIGIPISDRLRYESFLHPDGDIIHKYCDKRDGSNLKVKHTP